MASSGHNGRNESFIGFSYSIGLSFLDQDGNEIVVNNMREPIEMLIPRDPNLLNNHYLLVNVSDNSSTSISNASQILRNAFVIYPTNASLHIQIKPDNESVGYLTLIKLGSSPILDTLTKMYDFWHILCPNSSDFRQVYDNTTGSLDYYYLIFLSMEQVRQLKFV